MAKLVAYYNLCPIHDTKEFLGLSPDREEGNIITTLGRNIIVVIKLSSQKQINSWTVQDKLSSKVVYDKQSKKYVGVFGNRQLRCWDENDVNICKLKRIKFHKNIADLICTEDDGVILLYSDGNSESLSCGLENRGEDNVSTAPEVQSQLIVDANVFKLPDGRKLLSYFAKNTEMGCTELVTQLLDEETLRPLGKPLKYILSRHNQDAALAGCTVIEGQNSPCLLTIWSDKRVFMLPLNDETTPQDAPGNFISMISVLNVDNPLSISPISKHCIAIYGANNNQEGASLILYNTQFKVVQAKQFFKIYFNFSRLWKVENNILLAMGQNLSVVSFRMSKELLSEMIGSQVSNDTQDYVAYDFINEDDELEESLCYASQSKDGVHKTPKNLQFCEDRQAADGKMIPFKNYCDFEDEMNSVYEKNLFAEYFLLEKENELQLNIMNNFNDSGFPTQEIDIVAKELEKRGAGEQEITEKLLPILIKANLIDDIAVCLRRYTNIYEKVLVGVLNYALTDLEEVEEKPCQKVSDLDRMEVDIEGSKNEYPNVNIFLNQLSKVSIKQKKDLVNVVLSCSIEPRNISPHIRKEVAFRNAVVLLEHLYSLITSSEICLEERPETSVEFDDDVRILEWFGIVLNAHFHNLVLSRDSKVVDLLMKWSEIVTLYRKDLLELRQLASVLHNVVNKKLIPNDRKYSKWYSIEEVKLY